MVFLPQALGCSTSRKWRTAQPSISSRSCACFRRVCGPLRTLSLNSTHVLRAAYARMHVELDFQDLTTPGLGFTFLTDVHWPCISPIHVCSSQHPVQPFPNQLRASIHGWSPFHAQSAAGLADAQEASPAGHLPVSFLLYRSKYLITGSRVSA